MSEARGLKELSRALKQFPPNVQKNIMVGAVRAGASLLAKEEKKNLKPHDDTAQTRKSVGIVRRKSDNKNIVKFSVGPRKSKGGWKAHFLEYGTSKMAAIPFARPAFENKGPETIDAVKKYAAKRIPKEIEKAKR
ncbi:HK97-gp10 family putative phage morphogenesis protein [Sulfurimonas sp. HSL1-6]|uniref:HK97-gp10 family putative phage morphogenesis protein n=1 Tax=Thiomicrolovo immobilis TaxID=3131935 RepID=UPI0031F83B22